MTFLELNASGTYPADFELDLMVSNDGLPWPGPIYTNIIGSSQSGQTFNYFGGEIKEGSTYKMWHSATSDWNIAGSKLYYSTSQDGMNYTGHGMVLDNGLYPTCDSRNIDQPWVFKT